VYHVPLKKGECLLVEKQVEDTTPLSARSVKKGDQHSSGTRGTTDFEKFLFIGELSGKNAYSVA